MSITAPSESRYRISDDWLDANATDREAYIDVLNMTSNRMAEYPFYTGAVGSGPNAKANPRGVSIDGALDERGTKDVSMTYGGIAGLEVGESETIIGRNMITPIQNHPAILATHILHPMRFRKIYAYGTTARGIWIHQ